MAHQVPEAYSEHGTGCPMSKTSYTIAKQASKIALQEGLAKSSLQQSLLPHR